MEKETVVRKLVREQANSLQPERHEAAKVRSGQSPDRLGFLTLKATESSPEASLKFKNGTPEIVTNLAQLLEASEKITVGETTLRQVYETKLISERGLRRAINAYRRGGDVRRILAEELLIKEIGYELDPQLRDRPIKSSQLIGAKVKVENLNSETSAKIGEDAVLSENLPSNPLSALKPATRRTGQPVLIVANIVAVIVLLILVLVLLITRK